MIPGKKIVFGTAITLALILSGCGESPEDKQEIEGKAAFKQAVEFNFPKAKAMALKTFSEEKIQKWIDEDPKIQLIEKSWKDYESKKGKHIDFSQMDWSNKKTGEKNEKN